MRAWALLLLLATAGLTGCIGGSDDAGTTTGTTMDHADMEGGQASPMPGVELEAPVGFDAAPEAHQVAWENGTFLLTEHSYPKGLVTGQVGEYDPDRRTIDLTPMIPQGQPVLLTAEIHADLGEGDVDVWVSAPEGEIWTSDYDTPYGGYSALEVMLVHTSSEPVTLTVRYDEVDDSTSFDYTLRIGAHTDPAVLPAGVPVGVHVPAEATGLQVEFPDETEGRAVLLWDPQDVFLGRFDPGDERLTLPVNGTTPTGEYVVMLAEGSGYAHVSLLGLEQAPADLRPLQQVIEMGPVTEAAPGESEISWSFEVQRVPLQTGIFWGSSEVSKDTRASLSSPSAELIGLDIEADPWLGGAGFGIITDMGVAGLVTGTYEAQVAFGENAGPTPMEAGHWLVYYDRGR